MSSVAVRRGRLVGVGGIVLLLLGWALAERLRLPSPPFADHDVSGYLLPAIRLFTEGRLVHLHSREFPYPLFVHGVARLSDGVTFVAVAQHVIGVASGLLLLAAWQRVPLPGSAPPFLAPIRAGIGFLLVASYLLLAHSIVYEHLVRPEALSQAVQCVLLFASLSVLRLERGSPHLAYWFCLHAGVAFVGASLLGLLRPQTTLILPVWILWLLWSAWRLRVGAKVGAIALLAPALLSLVALWLPERRLAEEDRVAGRFLPATLFFYHFNIVRPQVEEDLVTVTEPREKKFLRDLLAAYEEERARQVRELHEARWYTDWEFNPDLLFFGRAGEVLARHFGDDRRAYQRFAFEHFFRAVRSHPADYVGKVWHELLRYYGWRAPTIYDPDPRIELRDRTRTSLGRVAMLARHVPHPMMTEWARELRASARAMRSGSPGVVYVSGTDRPAYRYWYEALNRSFLPVLGVAGLLALTGRGRRDETGLVVAFLVPAGYAFGANLTAAASHGLVATRFAYAITALSFFSQFAALFYVIARAAGWQRGLRAESETDGHRAEAGAP